ncbi:MAG TPA: reverse transcriptase domain-containing protein [Steroidobacteraceae bacterium]|nr:reverse transcriptase domain-containing protein [Steroidobacteraceae bacterium]
MPSKAASASQIARLRACATAQDLADLLGTSKARLLFHLFAPTRPSYSTFEIPKKSGKKRLICAPPRTLMKWQREVLTYLTALYARRDAVHGFTPGWSIKSNAAKHVEKNLVLNFDLLNFFPTIHFGRVRGMFSRAPFNLPDNVAAMLAQLCTVNGELPQGAPTSPMISNFICRRLDADLARLASRSGCTYTRFADDITFSTSAHQLPSAILASSFGASPVTLGDQLLQTIYKHSFKVNPAKTRVQTSRQRQQVTGLTVNRRVNVSRRYIRELRKTLRAWNQAGLATAELDFQTRDSAAKTRRFSAPPLRKYVRGKLEFLRMVRGKGDPIHARYAIQASKLPGYYDRAALLEGAATKMESFLSEAVWVVAEYDASGKRLGSGTAFWLEGVGFVSARHVFENTAPGYKPFLVRSCKPWDIYPIKSFKDHPNTRLDITVLEAPGAKAYAMLRRTKHSLVSSAQVAVIGFPSWNTTGDKLLRADTSVVQLKTVSMCNLASVGYSLLSGASGGPVLDKAGHVTGVIITNKDDNEMPNGFISIEHLDAVLGAPSKPT